MMNSVQISRSCLVTLGLLLLLCAPRGAWAQDFAAAGEHFAAAQDAFSQGQFARAATEFQAAYDITKDPALLFNIGESAQRAGDYRKAADSYRAYLKELPSGGDRAEAERRLKELDAALAAGLTGPPGAPKPAPPPGPAAKAEQAVPPPTSKPVVPTSRLRIAAWGGVALTTALLTAGGVLGLGAQDRADELNRRTTMLSTSGQPPVYDADEAAAYTSLQSDGQAYNIGAIVCLSLAGATAVASAVLFALDLRHRSEPRTDHKAALLRPLRIGGGGAAAAALPGGSF